MLAPARAEEERTAHPETGQSTLTRTTRASGGSIQMQVVGVVPRHAPRWMQFVCLWRDNYFLLPRASPQGGEPTRGGVLLDFNQDRCEIVPTLTAREQPLARPGHAHKPCGCCALSLRDSVGRAASRRACARARISCGAEKHGAPTCDMYVPGTAHHIFSPSSSRELRTFSGDSHLGVCIQRPLL